MPNKFRQILAILVPLLLTVVVYNAAAIPDGVDLEQSSNTEKAFVGPKRGRQLVVADLRTDLCRVKHGRTVCVHYSFKDYPLNLKGAAFMIEHCIPENENFNFVSQLNAFCDMQWEMFNDKALFKTAYPACWPVWRTAKRVQDGTQEADFIEHGCKDPIFITGDE